MSSSDRSIVYLDHNATTPVVPEVIAAMNEVWEHTYFNPSSIHRGGEITRELVDDARASIGRSLGVRASEITFTSGATEAIVWALRGVLEARPERRRIVTTAVEHSAVLDTCERLERRGYEIVRLPVEADGTLAPEAVVAALTGDTALLSVLWANNETGVFIDVDTIGEIARERKVPFHVDAVQVVGKGVDDLESRPVDLVSFSGHKFGAPKGIGGLWARRGTRIRPLIWGGHHERGRRGGTENLAGIVAMARALTVHDETWRRRVDDIGKLRDRLEHGIVERTDAFVIGAGAKRVANTVSIGFRNIEGAAVVRTLSERGVYASPGSACTAGVDGPSHVLAAMAVPGDFIHGAVRFSLGLEHTEAEIDAVVEAVAESVRHVSRVNTA